MGKGDKRRPTQVDDATFEDRWRKAFGHTNRYEKKQTEEAQDQPPTEESK